MGGVLDWSTTPGSNTTVDGVSIAEGMQAGLVNNGMRAIMALVREWQLDASGVVTAGAGNAYTITSNQGIAAYADGLRFSFRADRNNTGASTLNVDGRGAKALRKTAAGALTALAADDIVAEAVYDVVYDVSSDVFVVVGTHGVAGLTAFGQSLISAADAAAGRTVLSLGTVATESIVPLAKGGTGVALVDPNADRILFWDDSAGAVAFLEAGAGLTISGTTISSGARVLLATKTASASATLDFTEFNNAAYKWYEFEPDDILPATDGATFRMRFSTNAGVSYDSGASDYSYGNVIMEDSGTPQNDNSGGATFINLMNGYGAGLGAAAGELGVRGTLKLYGAGNAASKTSVNGLLMAENTSGRMSSEWVSGRRTTAQDTDAVRFYMSAGNITSGTIRMYGIVA